MVWMRNMKIGFILSQINIFCYERLVSPRNLVIYGYLEQSAWRYCAGTAHTRIGYLSGFLLVALQSQTQMLIWHSQPWLEQHIHDMRGRRIMKSLQRWQLVVGYFSRWSYYLLKFQAQINWESLQDRSNGTILGFGIIYLSISVA